MNIEEQIKKIEKQYGPNSIMKLGENNIISIPRIKTGIMSVDTLIGGGLPKGRIVELYGDPSCGKTSLALQTIASAQQEGIACVYIDAEHALDLSYISKLGVDVDELYLSQPDYGEQALNIAYQMADVEEVGLIVIDSVSALVPKAVYDGEIGDQNVGNLPRLMSGSLNKFSSKLSKTETTLIFINQLRQKIGVMYGNPNITSGGNALRFYASLRLQLVPLKSQKIANSEGTVGNRVKIKVEKSKVCNPFQETECSLVYGIGFDKERDLIEYAVKIGVVEKSGAWINFGEEKYQGLDNFIETVRENKDMFNNIKEMVDDIQSR